MLLKIKRDYFDNPMPPKLFLCQTDKSIIGELKAYAIKLNGKWNSYSSLEFSINRTYIDAITGESKVDPLFDLTEGLRVVYAEDIGYFQVQDPDSTYSDNETKALSCFSLEYSTSQKYLENFYVNTGDNESVEVTYWSSKFGDDYWNQDNYYKKANSIFDPYIRYYYKNYSDSDSYVYEEKAIANEEEFLSNDGTTVEKTLYIKSFPNVSFYNPTTPQLSLLHLIFTKIPEWKIGHVDYSLQKKERKFSEERIAVYDFLTNNVSDTFKCIVEWDTITNTVNFYEEAEDGITENNEVQDRYDTDIYISRENLANNINVKYSTDNIKTKLKVSGGEEMSIRDVNLGQNYIMNLDYYATDDWMGVDLHSKYEEYKRFINGTEENEYKDGKKYEYTQAMQRWVAAYNKWNDLVNAIPAEGNVLLVGDPFTKLYCTHPFSYRATEYIKDLKYYVNEECTTEANPQPDSSTDFENNTYYVNNYTNALGSLEKDLDLYCSRVGYSTTDPIEKRDTDGKLSDNVLLTLKHSDNQTATIRVYYDVNETVYKVKCVITNTLESTTVSNQIFYSLGDWIKGNINSDKNELKDYKIKSIGTLGAYLCITKNETIKANLQDYGVRLLKEKHQIYMKVFQTQTEGLLSDAKNKCIVSNICPTGEIPDGTRWLDTDSNPVKLYSYQKGYVDGEFENWKEITAVEDKIDSKDYARYIENYNKLQAVQEVLVEKEKEAEMYLNGIQIEGVYLDVEHRRISDFRNVATQYFGLIPANESLNDEANIYSFELTENEKTTLYAIYLDGNIPYVSYADSQGANLAHMNNIKNATNMENYFSEGEWMRISPFIREDEFSDSNVFLTGYESEEERLSLCNELVKLAEKELKTLSKPSLEFTMTMANILALPEFEPIKHQFKLGNFVRIGLPNNMVKRARLLECTIEFDDMSNFSCTFGNLITTQDQIDIFADLQKQAIQAGKTVASNAANWQKAVDKSNSIDKAIQNGLADATLNVGKANGQSIEIGQHGIWGRKLVEGTTDTWEPEQFRIMNNRLVFSSDGFKTSKSVFGKYVINGEERWGLCSEYVDSGVVTGSTILGGSLKIGDYNNPNGTYFSVDENGNVSIQKNGQTAYADSQVVAQIEEARQYHIELSYSNSTVFNTLSQTCTITAKLYKWDEDITSKLPSGTKYSWIRNSSSDDTSWNASHIFIDNNTITITNDDVNTTAQFSCQIDFDDINL